MGPPSSGLFDLGKTGFTSKDAETTEKERGQENRTIGIGETDHGC